MRLWTYQHPSVLETLRQGYTYRCSWEWSPDLRWQAAFHWMGEQMALRNIHIGQFAPVWAWHSVNRLGGKPDEDCANALLFGYQLVNGIQILELEVPDHLVLVSCYGTWGNILDELLSGQAIEDEAIAECFSVRLFPRRGRPRLYFRSIQACLPYIEPSWLVASERMDTEKMLRDFHDMHFEPIKAPYDGEVPL